MKTEDIIKEIKLRLIFEYFGEEEYHKEYDDIDSAWKEFVDQQKIGDCQYICNKSIIIDLPNVQIVFGEIETDYPSYEKDTVYDEEEEDYVDKENENFMFTHSWFVINDEIFEFSKGTLKDYIVWDDLYSVDAEDDNCYNELYII